MFRLNPLSTSLFAAFGGVLLAGAMPALAQPAAAPQQRIEITGTNIKRTDVETSSPVQIISREEIARSGAGSIRELIDTLAAATPSLSDISGSNSFASGASSASLRNLGKTSTLVLLNSRRVSPYALADFNEVFTNIDSLPIDAVERIEILKSGASAIYGSDAVAGVINIITRRSFNGLQVQAGYEESLKSKTFGSGTASITAGFGDLDRDRFNVLANVELYQRESVIWRDILQYMHPVTFARIPQTFAAQASTFAYPGNVVGANPAAIRGCPAELVITNLCRYDRYTRFEAQPEAKRINALLTGTYRISGNLDAFAELLYSKTETTYISPFPIYGNANSVFTVWGNPQTNQGQTFVGRGLGAQHPLNPLRRDDVDFRYRFVDANTQGTPESDNYRLQLGLRGVSGAWDWEAGLGFLGSKVTDLQGGRFSNSGFIKHIGDYNADPLPADFFNKPNGYKIGQPNSPQVIAELFPTFGTIGETKQTVLDGKASTEIGQLAGSPVGLAIGVDLRRETFRIDPSENLRQGDIVGFGLSATDGSRSFGAAFAELSLKPMKTLELQLAARADKYPKLTTNISPKLAARFEPASGVVFRGSYETGFRAPNLTETAPSVKFAFNNGVLDPKRCPAAEALAEDLIRQAATAPADQATLLEARADTVVSNECAGGVASIVGNNPELKPEKSKSYTFGLALEPARNVGVTIDYWNIKRRDEIDLRGASELLSAEDGGALPAGSSIARDPLALDATFTAAERARYGVTVGALNAITRSFENVSRTKTSGVDVSVNGRTRTSWGTLTTDVNLTYVDQFKRFSPVRGDYGDNLAGRWLYPRVSANLTLTLSSDRWTHGVKARHTSSTSLQGDFFDTGWSTSECATRRPAISAGECRVAPETLFDVFVQYKGFQGLVLGAYVRNVFDKQPPPDLRDLFENGSNIIPQNRFDAKGRTLRLTASYKFF